jgi:hypothetical protein
MQTQPARIFRARHLRVRRHAVIFGIGLVLCVGCSRHSTPEPAPARSRTSAAGPKASSDKSSTSISVQSAKTAAPDTPAPEARPADAPPPRDFSAELVAMMTSAASCLKAQLGEQPGGPVMIGLTANVMPSGAVRHGAVSGSLAQDELDCVRRLLETLHFAAPIENAPFAVQASLKVNRPTTSGEPVQQAAREADTAMVVPDDYAPTPGVVPTPDPGELPTPDPGVVPPEDPGVVPPEDPGVVPPSDPPASIAGSNE